MPVLITWDIDPDSWIPPDKRRQALHTAMNLCENNSVRATFFFTARGADIYPAEFEMLKSQGHEIGCHGLTHGIEENYDRMPEAMQRAYLKEATETLQTLAGEPMRAFRAPRVKTSALTLQLLPEYGYRADSSVCSQRLDLISSNLINVGWLVAPRRPYHPSARSAFKAGDVPIWEIPISASIVPFISTSLRVLGLEAMKVLFKLLYWEARRTGKPIVYLAHPTEFLQKKSSRKAWRQFLGLKYLRPSFIRAHGLRWRNLFYRIEGQNLAAHTLSLLAYAASFPDVTFMTVSDYLNRHLTPP